MEQQFAQYSKLLLMHLPLLGSLGGLALPLCLAGLPFLAVMGQGLAYSRDRGAYDKCARQLGRLGNWLGAAGIIGGGIALGMQCQGLTATDIKNFAARENVLPLLMAAAWLCIVLFTLLNALYTCLWHRPRTAPRLHQLLGFLAALAAAGSVYAALLHLFMRSAAFAAPADPRGLLMPDAQVFWTALSHAPFAALALAGGYGALWLLLRRVADDYGRDHYNLVIPWCAGWARNAWLLLWLFVAGRAGWRAFQLYEATGGKPDWFQCAPDAIGLLVLLPPALWWLGVSRSTTPLRAKIALFLAPLWATGCLPLLDMGVG